ncbi:winged helix-turn-helix transcriptional regulator [Streptomyces sp. NPDC002446]
MSTAFRPDISRICSIDAQRVEEALRVIARKSSTWVVQTLAQHRVPMRVCDIAAQLPFVRSIYGLLEDMHFAGLINRAGGHTGVWYQLSEGGWALFPVHRALSEWSQAYLSRGTMADAERVENAVRRLHLRQSTAVIQVLDAYGAMPLIHISEEANLGPQYTLRRLERLQSDGLVARSGSHHMLTAAGRALGPVYTAVERWSEAHRQGTESGR